MKTATITLKTSHHKFVTAEDGGGPQSTQVGDRPAGLATANRPAAGAWETLEVRPCADKPDCVSLWSVNGFALAAEADSVGTVTGPAVFNRTKALTWETWRVGRHHGGITLQAHDGQSYLCAEPDGRLVVRRPGSADGKPSVFETFFPDPASWLEVDPIRPDRAPGIVGQLTIANGTFADSRGPILPVLCHAGDLIGQGLVLGLDRIKPGLDQIANAGYHGIRSWWVVWPGGPNAFWDSKPAPRWDVTAQTFDRFVEILGAGAARGLKWHLAAGGVDGFSDAQCNERFDRVAEAVARVGPEHFALIEGVNEARDTAGDREPADIARFVQRIRSRHPAPLYGLSAYTGHEDRDVLKAWTPDWMKFYIVHGWRGGRTNDKVRHIFSLGYDGEAATVRRLGWQGEPTGPGKFVSATEAQGELNDEALALMAAMSAVCRQAWVYMSSPGVIFRPDVEPFTAMPGFIAVPRMVRLLPQDVMTYTKIAHGGATWHNLRPLEAQDEVRCDYAMDNSGKFVAVVYGPGGTYNMKVSRSFEGAIIHPGTGAAEPIRAQAGTTVRMNFAHGRVIVGKTT